jgi:hypothetical protein
MKSGKTINELAAEITRQNEAKKDFIAPVSKLAMDVVAVAGNLEPVLKLGDLPAMPIGEIAHSQLAEYTGIPLAYYRKMAAEAPELLVENMNRWLSDHAEEKRMVRTLDGRARAVLSNKYRALDNHQLAEAVLPVLLQQNMIIMSAEITERRLYIKAVDRSIEQNVPTGRKIGDGSHVFFDTLSPAVTISNSEVGFGALSIESSIFTKVCTNLATFGSSMRKYHTGARAALSDDVYALLSDSTRNMTDAATFGQVRDIINAIFDKGKFATLTEKLQAAGEDRVEVETVTDVIEVVGKKHGLIETERKGVLARLIEGGDFSRYGVHSAITRHSADVLSYDRATELERLGGQIIEMPRNEWAQLLKAA